MSQYWFGLYLSNLRWAAFKINGMSVSDSKMLGIMVNLVGVIMQFDRSLSLYFRFVMERPGKDEVRNGVC